MSYFITISLRQISCLRLLIRQKQINDTNAVLWIIAQKPPLEMCLTFFFQVKHGIILVGECIIFRAWVSCGLGQSQKGSHILIYSHTKISILILYQEKAITCHTKKHFHLEIFHLEIYYQNDLVIQCLTLFIGCLIEESE